MNDFVALVITGGTCLGWLSLAELLVKLNVFTSKGARKMVHIGTGLIFMLCWNLFPRTPQSYLYATFIPLCITLRVLLAGMSVFHDQNLIKSMTRNGDPKELLIGPLAYSIIFTLSTFLYWGDSPTGIVALVLLCVGDGMAELIGSRYGTVPLPYNPKKSYAGSIAFAVSAFAVALIYLLLFWYNGWFTVSLFYLPVLVIITVAAAGMESITTSEWDNITVFLTCLFVSRMFGY
eukprot:Phypoly_transcript_18386.p1 GENE.Phypoly_transcript_18386~~Phypoly_transcript_18386.p1  ORF type:complete len:234 (+),score=5.23 Phypoly_transcript_18386:51-752(+)